MPGTSPAGTVDEAEELRRLKPVDPGGTSKVEVLLYRYEHLNDAHYQHNQVIHTTFYLSIVFFAGFLSIVFTADASGSYVNLISGFASVIFGLLGIWAWRYNRGREEIKHRQAIIRDELGRYDFDLVGDRTLEDTFFFEHDHSADQYKKYLHTSYYVILAALSLVVPLVIL